MPRLTHYDVLGVSPSADAQAIREAYRRLAREHHPDRTRSQGHVDRDISMPTINEAYRVLNDPARRAVYDASLRGAPERGSAAPPRGAPTPHGAPTQTGQTEASPSMPTFPSHLGPARFPWRSVTFFAMLAIVGIVVLAQFTEPGEPQGPDGIMRVGSCVEIEANGDAREVNCTDDPEIDLVVEAFIPFDGVCPAGSVPHRDRQGMGVACVALQP